jgi:hypothetical protein
MEGGSYSLAAFGIGALLGTIGYAFYVQFSPKIGGIWLRPDEFGNTVFTPMNLIRQMFYPFCSLQMWKLELLDLNWPIVAVVSGLIANMVTIMVRCDEGGE